MKKVLAVLATVLSFAANAQITTSDVSGKVVNAKGEVISGAAVQLVYNPLSVKYNMVTDVKGNFHVNNINAGGPYTISVKFVGYKTFSKSDLSFTLGSNPDVTILLEEISSQLTTVTVSASKSTKKDGAALVINEDKLRTVPNLSRSITDFTKLVPQSSNNSFAGTNFRYNNVTIDGTINNDAIGFSPSLGGQSGTSGMPGSSTRTSPISIDAIKDIQVYLAPFDVKVGNFLGGSINAVTRSGTNEVKGSIYYFGRNAGLTGISNAGSFKDGQYGFRLGLPIVKNKLFWFTSVESTNRTEPVQYGANAGGLVSDSLANAIASFTKTKYGINVGAYDNYDIYSKSTKVFNRFDWNINDNNQLTVRNNTVFSEATNLERDLANFRFASMDFKQNNNQNSTVLELRSHYGKTSNSLILGYSDIHDYRTPLSGNMSTPQVEIAYNGGTIFLGNDREATVFNMKQKTTEFTDNFNFSLGNHNILIGTHNEFYDINYGFVNAWNGRIAYKSVADYLASNVNRVRGFYAFNNNTRDYLFDNPYAKYKVNLLSGYIQDEIALGRIKITPGIRFDYTGLPNKPALSAQAAVGYTNDYFNNVNVSPRVGFNWDVKGDRTLVVRGGSGVFVGRIPFAWLGYAYYNDGVGFGSFDVNNVAGKNKGDVLADGAKAFAFNNGQANLVQTDLISNGFKMPKVWRTNIAIDKTIQGYKFTIEGLYTQVLTDLMFQQINFKTDAANYSYYSYDVNKEMPIYNGVKVNTNLSNAYALSNTDKGYRYSYTASVNKKYPFGVDFYAAYTYGVSKDITNGIRNSMESNWQLNQSLTPNNPQLAYSNFDIRHRIISNLNYKINKTQVGLLFNAQSGVPFTWGLVNATLAGTPQSAGLVYIFKDVNQASTYIPTAGQAQAFMDFVNSNSYLSSRKGNFTERNGDRTPWMTTVDMKIVQFVGKNLQITADIFNLGNMLNNDWGKMYFASNTFNSTSSVGLAKTAGAFSSAGVLTDAKFSFTKPTVAPYSVDMINSKWQIQLGIRYSF
jgi:hypothetical protein